MATFQTGLDLHHGPSAHLAPRLLRLLLGLLFLGLALLLAGPR